MSSKLSSDSSGSHVAAELQTALCNIGMSQKEATLYLSALSLGPATVLRLSKASGLRRTTVYSIIQSLQQKGLMAAEERGFKRLFVAENPERLESLLENRRKVFADVLPKLNGLFNLPAGESVIKYYQGLEGMKAVYESLLRDVRPGDDYLIISNPDDWIVHDKEFFEDFLDRRSRLDIKIRGLFQRGPVGERLKKLEKRHNQTIRFLPPGTKLPTNMVIIPKKVVIHQLVPPVMAYVIENQSVVQLQRQLFEIIWATTPEG